MNVAIIGASGFIGLRTCELLGEHPELNIVPVVRSYTSLAVLARREYPDGWRVCSLLDSEKLSKGLSGCDACIHAAIGDAIQIPVMAKAAYEACSKAGVNRLIWLSSASVHGQNPPANTDESSPLHDKHTLIYNNAKVRAEWTLEKLQADGNVDVFRMRPSVVYGPRSRWITDIARDLLNEKAAWINKGFGVCNAIYVDNLVQACRLALSAPRESRNAFLVGDSEKILWRDFIGSIARHLGYSEDSIHDISPPVYLPEHESRWQAFTFSKPYARASSAIPARLKRIIKAARRSWNAQEKVSAYRLPETPKPCLSHEMSLLQQNTWQLANNKAEEFLGYKPEITFKEGMRRSLKWADYVEINTKEIK